MQRKTQVPVRKHNNRQHASPHHEVATDVKQMPIRPIIIIIDVLAIGLNYAVHLEGKAGVLCDHMSGTLILHLPQYLLLRSTVQQMVLQIIGHIVEVFILDHVLVDILVDIFCVNFKQGAVSISAEELLSLSIMSLHLVVVEVCHQVLGEDEDAHYRLHWVVEH